MRLIRFAYQGRSHYGVLDDDVVFPLTGPPVGDFALLKYCFSLSEVQLLAPCEPSKIIALGLNYRDHAAEMRMALPTEPLIFLKPSTAVIGPSTPIVYPPQSHRVDYEAELGVVIGRPVSKVSEAKAKNYILGYTCVNDVTARDLQKKDGQFTRSKSFDTFCPLGPWIETDIADPDNLVVEAILNGERRQHSTTQNLVFGVAALISFISHIMTLLPGDVIATGTPSGVGPMQPGDHIEIRVEGVGSLHNHVTR
ncbi:fumarylacetoacetate hydrolase family protein [Desulfobacca acetoxidans]